MTKKSKKLSPDHFFDRSAVGEGGGVSMVYGMRKFLKNDL
jgi:hypothetical protein